MKGSAGVLLVVLMLSGLPVAAQDESGVIARDGGSLVEPDRQFSQPGYRERYQSLTWVLRCPQCENQAIGDSNAPVSELMRDRVADLIEAGHSDDEIIAYMKDRWGEQVTFSPGLGAHTGWILVVAVLGGLILVGALWGIRRQHGGVAGQASGDLSEAEREQLNRLRQRSFDRNDQ